MTRESLHTDDGASAPPRAYHERDYEQFLLWLHDSFATTTKGASHLFRTDVDGRKLWKNYLFSLPADTSTHRCHACREFIHRYGSLAVIDDKGELTPALWNVANMRLHWSEGGAVLPTFYTPVVSRLYHIVRDAKVTGVFLDEAKVWGRPTTGEWSHMAVTPAEALVFKPDPLSDEGAAHQVEARIAERFRMTMEALAVISPRTANHAMRLLQGGEVHRAEKFTGPLQWFTDLQASFLQRGADARKANIVWRAVAMAPEGYAHIRNSVLGSLMEDISNGIIGREAVERFNMKLDPTRYQRTVAAPEDGTITRAENVFLKPPLRAALRRRYAKLEDIPSMLWRPAIGPRPAPGDERRRRRATDEAGLFSHLRNPLDDLHEVIGLAQLRQISWARFQRTVLPTAERVWFTVPMRGSFIGVLTAVDPQAVPIIKWDTPEERNPLSWYVHHKGSLAEMWGLNPGHAVEVSAISRFPCEMGARPLPSLASGAILYLKGMRPTRLPSGGTMLFPELLQSALHPVRRVIEQFSRGDKLEGREEATACGYEVRESSVRQPLHVRVFSAGAWMTYHIDRID